MRQASYSFCEALKIRMLQRGKKKQTFLLFFSVPKGSEGPRFSAMNQSRVLHSDIPCDEVSRTGQSFLKRKKKRRKKAADHHQVLRWPRGSNVALCRQARLSLRSKEPSIFPRSIQIRLGSGE